MLSDVPIKLSSLSDFCDCELTVAVHSAKSTTKSVCPLPCLWEMFRCLLLLFFFMCVCVSHVCLLCSFPSNRVSAGQVFYYKVKKTLIFNILLYNNQNTIFGRGQIMDCTGVSAGCWRVQTALLILCCDASRTRCVLICCIWLCLLCFSLPLLWPAACFLESLPTLCVLVYIHHPLAHSLHFHSLTHKMHLLVWAYVWELAPQSVGIVLVMILMILPLVVLTGYQQKHHRSLDETTWNNNILRVATIEILVSLSSTVKQSRIVFTKQYVNH